METEEGREREGKRERERERERERASLVKINIIPHYTMANYT